MRAHWRALTLCAVCALFAFVSNARARAQGVVPPVEATEPAAVEPGKLRPAPAVPPASRPPAQPAPEVKRKLYRELARGVFVRPSYAAAGAELRVEVWGVVVAPGASEPARFPGAVMFELIDGSLEVVEPKRGAVRSGASFAVDEGGRVVLHNVGDRPATLRAVVVRGMER